MNFEETYKEKKAVISDCGKYRYELHRQWDKDKDKVLFIMLNPSTADSHEDDLNNPNMEDLKKYFLCDTLLRKQGLLYFCRLIEDIEYETIT